MRKLLTLTVLLVPMALQAQDLSRPWTLQECLDWALEHNLTVKQGENAVAQQKIRAHFQHIGDGHQGVNTGNADATLDISIKGRGNLNSLC